jgi:RNA polymerase sigma-70 factor (ECF subfamily)
MSHELVPENVTAALPGLPGSDVEFATLRTRLLRHARYAVSDHGLAEDLVQDTLIAVVEQGSRHRGESSRLTWALAILKNKIADWYRAPAQRRVVQLAPEDEELGEALEVLYQANGMAAEMAADWQQPENREEQRQMMRTLDTCLGNLPRQTGRVFMMREWLGFETGEICERLGLSAENCRTILYRARTALRVCMQHNWLDAKVRP